MCAYVRAYFDHATTFVQISGKYPIWYIKTAGLR